jgi:hypothetical protein
MPYETPTGGQDEVVTAVDCRGMVIVSFDIDGTLEEGDPPGPVLMTQVLVARQRGYVIGSASDRTVREQNRMWERNDIVPDFVGHKHHLDRVAARFPGARMIHLGDTQVDEHFAQLAGFEFFHVDDLPEAGSEGWIF